MVADPRVNHVSFTGSVAGGAAVHRAAGGLFKGVGLELGGKDPAYVRHDADVAFAADNLAEGFLFNAGQSCCAIERIFVHDAVFDDFVSAMSAAVYRWKMGDPMDIATTLGPVVRASAAATSGGNDCCLARDALGGLPPIMCDYMVGGGSCLHVVLPRPPDGRTPGREPGL